MHFSDSIAPTEKLGRNGGGIICVKYGIIK